ncbi:MAG: prepilin-type N-terminal cleavage/methylation domain-containing protein [Rubrivivax sp.]|nr:prepilin-type N-terminal cleavage/methylation domain-containing protein [Rubrivivax sp.]
MNTVLAPRADQPAHGGPQRHARGRRQGHRSRGVSLIEALVALAVMAFGLLGVVGMQSSLRFNADVSRQRAEAVRLAQEKMESLRSFGVLSGAPTGELAYDDIATPLLPETLTALALANTLFTRTVTVTPTPTPPVAVDDPRMKTIVVTVSWLDRRTASGGTAESVRLQSNIAQIAPMLGATLGLPGDRAGPQKPRGRHVSIPPGAVDQRNGTSIFTPPGALSGATWTFVNATGQIVKVCSAGTPSTSTCAATTGWLLSGYIGFIARGIPPTPQLGESPDGDEAAYPGNTMTVTLTSPASPAVPPECFVERFSPTPFRAYYCFVPVTATSNNTWSGRSELSDTPFVAALAMSVADTDVTKYKVCRYTPDPRHDPPAGNVGHPLDYDKVNTSLINQNFLVHAAGSGSVAYPCPGDDPSTLINTNTFAHQPPN